MCNFYSLVHISAVGCAI